MSRRRHALAVVGAVTLGATSPAQAADPGAALAPTVSQCLAASDASLKADNEHRLRAERTQLLVCAAPSCPGEVRAECQRRFDEVSVQLPTVVFSAHDERGAELGAVRVTVDHDRSESHRAGEEIAVDPGEHVFVLESPGRTTVETKLVVVEGQKRRAERVVLVAVSAGDTSAGHGGSGRRWLGIGVGAAGVVGLAVGAAFGIDAIGKKNDAKKACPTDVCSTQSDIDAWNSASHVGTASTVSFIVGGALVATGAVLWLTAPANRDSGSATAASAGVGIGPGQLRLSGSF